MKERLREIGREIDKKQGQTVHKTATDRRERERKQAKIKAG